MTGTERFARARRVLVGLLLAGGAGAVAMVLAVALLAVRYDEPIGQVAHKLARFAALSAIRVGVVFHDASPPVVRPETGFPPASWQAAGAARRRFLERHPSLAMEGVPEPAPVPPRVPFHFAAFQPPQAERVRDFFQLEDFVAEVWARYDRLPPDDPWRAAFGPARPDLFLLYELTGLVNRLWAHSDVPTRARVRDFDVINMAERGRQGEKFYCHIYALALLQIAEALGYHGRLLSLSEDGNRMSHAVTEIWVNDLGRWVVFDPDFNLFYGGPRNPRNALEVRRALFSGQDPTVWPGRHPATVSYAERQDAVRAAYRNIEWHFRDDYWVNPYFKGHPSKSDANSVIWDDRLRSRALILKPKTDRVEAVYFPLFRWTLVPLAYDPEARLLRARLFLWYPGYAGFSVVSGDGTPVAVTRDAEGAVVALPLPQTENAFRLEVRSQAEARVLRAFSVRVVAPPT